MGNLKKKVGALPHTMATTSKVEMAMMRIVTLDGENPKCLMMKKICVFSLSKRNQIFVGKLEEDFDDVGV